MKAKAFVILKCQGEYDDWKEAPARVYLDETRAKATLAKLNEIAGSIDGRVRAISDEPWDGMFTAKRRKLLNKVAAEIFTEYLALGFTADFEATWEMAEVELDNA